MELEKENIIVDEYDQVLEQMNMYNSKLKALIRNVVTLISHCEYIDYKNNQIINKMINVHA